MSSGDCLQQPMYESSEKEVEASALSLSLSSCRDRQPSHHRLCWHLHRFLHHESLEGHRQLSYELEEVFCR